MRQLWQELADSLKKRSALEAPLEVISRYHAKLEVEARDLNLHQLTSQVCVKLNVSTVNT